MSRSHGLGDRGWNNVKPRSERFRGFAFGSSPGHAIHMVFLVCCMMLSFVLGCGGKEPLAGTAGSAGPSLDSKSADERAAAAREAAKKYGAEP